MSQIRYTLLNDKVYFRDYMALIGSIFVKLGENLAYTQRFCVKRCLRDESIGSRIPKKPYDASREAEQEQDPNENQLAYAEEIRFPE